MERYDAVVVLGSRPNAHDHKFPSHTYESLDRALALYRESVAPYIIVAGRYSIAYDHTGGTPPFHECDKQEEYLLDQGCPPEAIIKEGQSKDTITNLYHLKNDVFKPRDMRAALLVTAAFRARRIRFLWRKIVGSACKLTIESIGNQATLPSGYDDFVLQKQREFLEDMPDGDDRWLEPLYNGPMYQFWEKHDQALAAANT